MTDRLDSLVVPAPAKVNLFLHVTGRRADGYHTLESLMALVDLHDTITLERRADGAIARANALANIDEAQDLSLRAAHALREATGVAEGVSIGVHKRIPIGGGLGGGSSDAASVLLGLNRLWGLTLDRAQLAAIGAKLGADVPFFIAGESALVRGIGDVLMPVSLPQCWIALATPPVAVSTAEIFAAPELTRSTPSTKIHVFSDGYGRNDLEAVAAARFPEIGAAIAALGRGGCSARMTGSGACAIAAFASRSAADAALERLPRDIPGQIVRTLARHPLSGFA
jgi:4-diphosphocytidyl-2-C-methyl-D-erythritol kinase